MESTEENSTNDSIASSLFFFLHESEGRVSVRRPARTYLQQFCRDTECSLEDLPEAMDDRIGRREREGNPCEQHKMMMMIYIYHI